MNNPCDNELARIAAMSDAEAEAYLAALSPEARADLHCMAHLHDPAPAPNDDLRDVLALPDHEVAAALLRASPEFRIRLAEYVRFHDMSHEEQIAAYLAKLRALDAAERPTDYTGFTFEPSARPLETS